MCKVYFSSLLLLAPEVSLCSSCLDAALGGTLSICRNRPTLRHRWCPAGAIAVKTEQMKNVDGGKVNIDPQCRRCDFTLETLPSRMFQHDRSCTNMSWPVFSFSPEDFGLHLSDTTPERHISEINKRRHGAVFRPTGQTAWLALVPVWLQFKTSHLLCQVEIAL
ncbi:hypothetical protein MHYP_G00166570 [Metynnis hypsauchen]